ncbi:MULTISPECIES: DNA mismatch repair endonuclease MutL [unclassified Akkermansia]|uniref:DNA mismatch repair endonuclease MutL n=1 Tax=unclassified Akkermansia TaxID=2608915 RepID=UPI000E95C238|nr:MULTISPECIES: DNA mismatch repair endonuclease MutL [unclassified Akkermansia]HBI13791.1 DNA mismatch repair endonuclease MutL [Akkermansia sp.]HBN16530.1 DNA mismatch repair endonuclease MutL [Akkermansia sp.]
MLSIHVMSPTLASQVAAGEVVERPASVVKELVENSLDAGAKFVRVEIRRGGVGMIKVTDDGSGMSRADAELCTKRHATSKLSSLEELFEITHLGFRGEALPSIASVSRFKLCTRQQQELEGWEIRIDGGLEHEPRSSGVSPGTAIEVADLFYNTPARRKFLKSAETEASHVEHQIRLHALAYPQVRFAYKRDDQLVFDLPATADLRVRISALTDAATAAALIPIETTIGPGISITGFLLPLSEARRTRKGQYVFMNTRPVEDQLINRAIRDGYGGFPTGLHPALFLYMEVEPALVDVNVHPAKKEVRFRRSADVVNTIVEAIATTLQKHARQEIHAAAAPEPERILPAPSTTAPHGEIPARSTNPGSAFPTTARPAPASSVAQPPFSSSVRQSHGPVPAPTLRAIPLKQVPATQGKLDFHRQEDEETARNAHENAALARDASAGFSYLGTLRQQFALFETPEGLVLMHPKAARERIIFERLRAHREAPMPSQQLLDPVVLDLDPRDFAVIRQFAPHFDQAGMTVTPFGQNTIRIESIPALLELENARAFLLELVDRLTQSEFSRNAKRMVYETFIGEFARKSAWRERISPHRAPAILKDLLACEVPYCTPGGKPTLVNYSIPEIKRKFGIQA